jgi:AcrR family transcriptional regulator
VPRRRTYHHGNLRAALVDAATALLEADGPLGVTLRGAARLAGVSQAAPYRHFPDKDALLAAVAEKGFHEMARAGEEAAARHRDDAVATLRAMGIAYVRFATAHPSHYRLMFGPAVRGSAHPSLRQAAAAGWANLSIPIVACQRSGRFRSGDPSSLAFVLWCTVHGLATLIADEQIPPAVRATFSVDQLAAHAFSLVLDGFAPPST